MQVHIHITYYLEAYDTCFKDHSALTLVMTGYSTKPTFTMQEHKIVWFITLRTQPCP